jgi:D-glycero-D-manno-heptose 1,7-bisphosphate phosphatase
LSNSNGFRGTKRAVFIDRDGTLNVEKDYLYRVDDCELIPGAVDAVRRLNEAGWLVVVVTNQSGVARGYYGEQEVASLHRHMADELAQGGGQVSGWYFCPHHPAGQEPYNRQCDCRKPLPGMLLQAARELEIDLSRSWMVGDKLVDVQAGQAAGCRAVLVRTGYGRQESAGLPDGVPVCDDLAAAVELILAV